MEPLRVGDVVRSTQPMNGSREVAVSVQIGVGWQGKVQFIDDGGALIEFKDFWDGRQFLLRIRATEFERFAVQSHCDGNFASCESLPSEPPHRNDNLTPDELNIKLEEVGGF